MHHNKCKIQHYSQASVGKSAPSLPLRALRRLHIHLSLSHFIPICAERSPATLRVALHHRTLRVWVGVLEQILEELVHSSIATCVRVLVCTLVGLSFENVLGDRIPILARFWFGRRCFLRRSGGGRSRERLRKNYGSQDISFWRLVNENSTVRTIRHVAHELAPPSLCALHKANLDLHLTDGKAT